MELRLKPSPRMKLLYTVYAVIGVCAGVLSWSVPLALLAPVALLPIAALAWLPTALCLVFYAYWLPKYYESIEYLVEEGRIVARRGVWWRKEYSVPLAKVNKVTWHQGPLQRVLGLASVGFHTAAVGTPVPEVQFTDLEAGEAEKARRLVLSVVGAAVESDEPRRVGGELLEEILGELKAIRRILEQRS